MAKIVKTLILLVFATLFSASASAQYGTHTYCNGVWLPIGMQCRNGNVQQPICPDGSVWDGRGCLINNNQQRQLVIPQGVGFNQPFNAMVGGSSMRCTLLDRVASGLAQGLTAGALTWVVEKVLNRQNNDVSAGAFGLGVLSGATVTCEPLVSGNRQQVAQQQIVHQPSIPTCNPPKNPTGSRPGVLNIQGHPMNRQIVCAMPGDQNILRWLQ
ncbi:MAG: hypothetical protein WCT07_01470 [Candidatus Paceibacterota bacterium]